MRALSPVEITEMLPEKIPAKLERFETALPIECWEPGQIRRSIIEGFINAVCINDEFGRESHLLGWHLAPDGSFWVDILLALENPIAFDRVEKVVRGIAIAKGAKCMRCMTPRAGIAVWSQAVGWKPEMVVLTKVL